MQAAFGVTWYRLGSTLYFYSESELSRTFITPRAMTAERLYQMLRQSAVFAPQLPATLAPGGAMIVVSGPPTYLAQISAAVTAFEEAQITNFVMKVFPLKYAWAEDMSVNSMDKTVTIPGVASILRAMVTGSPNSATRVTQDTATVDKLSGTGLIAQGRMTPVAPDAPAPAAQQGGQAAPQNATQVNIMADPRVNAVLVNDAEYRMPYYAKVIADLDRPVELVEIHAAIVDIDSDFKRDLGVTYQGANSRDKGWSHGGEFSGTGDKFSPLPTMGTPSGTGMNLSTIYTHGADFFLARIQALEAGRRSPDARAAFGADRGQGAGHAGKHQHLLHSGGRLSGGGSVQGRGGDGLARDPAHHPQRTRPNLHQARGQRAGRPERQQGCAGQRQQRSAHQADEDQHAGHRGRGAEPAYRRVLLRAEVHGMPAAYRSSCTSPCSETSSRRRARGPNAWSA